MIYQLRFSSLFEIIKSHVVGEKMAETFSWKRTPRNCVAIFSRAVAPIFL